MTNKELYFEALKCDGLEGFEMDDYKDGMRVLKRSIGGWWKPLIILDDWEQSAFWFMNQHTELCGITRNDIDWESLRGMDEACIRRAENFDAQFPTNIRHFQDGVAEVEWQINPDGRYFMDDDGFGMSDDEEVSLYGYIDRHGKPLCKFTYVGENYGKLKTLRAQAIKALGPAKRWSKCRS